MYFDLFACICMYFDVFLCICMYFDVFVCIFLYFAPVDLITIERVQQSKSIQGEKKAFFVFLLFFSLFFPLFPVELEEKKTVKRVGHSFLRRVNPLFIAFTYTNRSSLFVIKYTKQIIAVPCQPSAVVRCFNPSRRVSRRQPP